MKRKERNREKSGNGTKGKWETTACRPKGEAEKKNKRARKYSEIESSPLKRV